MNETPWLKIAGLLIVAGIGAVMLNIAGKAAYDLLKK